jgi:hypothetical protein
LKKLTLILLLLLFVSCANRVDPNRPNSTYLWVLGWCMAWYDMLPDFIGLIWDDVAVYATNNNGTWYDFGFVGGLSIIKFIRTLLRGKDVK